MTAPLTVEDIQQWDNRQILKFTRGVLLLADYATAAISAPFATSTARVVANAATTAASPTLTAATAQFTSGDVGAGVSGTGIPAGATIIAFTSATSVTMSANATATGTGVSVTITPTSAVVGLAAVPTGYRDVGFLTTDGVTFSRNISMNEVNSWQSQEVTQSDVETDTQTFHMMGQQTSNLTLGLVDNLLISQIPAAGARYDVPRSQTGQQPLRRALFIAEAKDTTSLIYQVKFFPQVKISAVGDEQFARTTETRYDLTFTAYPDKVYGSSSRRWVDGPGWAAFAA